MIAHIAGNLLRNMQIYIAWHKWQAIYIMRILAYNRRMEVTDVHTFDSQLLKILRKMDSCTGKNGGNNG